MYMKIGECLYDVNKSQVADDVNKSRVVDEFNDIKRSR